MALIGAADFAKAKPTIKNGSYSGGVNLPGAFGQHYAPKPAPTASSGGGGGGGGGGGSTTSSGGGGVSAPVDPYNAQQHAFLNTLGGALSNIQQSGSEAFSSAGRTLQGSAEALYNKILTGQRGINTTRENTELNRLNGINDIVAFVRNGLQSGATRLSNANALESSAAGALAQAYNKIGNSKAQGVNNQAFLDNRNTDITQQNLDLQRSQGVTDFHRQRDEIVSNIGSQVRQQLAQLDQQAAGLNLPGRVAIDQEKQKVLNAGQGAINAANSWLDSKLGGIHPENTDAVKAAAAKLRTAGYDTGNPFNAGLGDISVNSTAGGGAPISQLPFYTRSGKDQTQQ